MTGLLLYEPKTCLYEMSMLMDAFNETFDIEMNLFNGHSFHVKSKNKPNFVFRMISNQHFNKYFGDNFCTILNCTDLLSI